MGNYTCKSCCSETDNDSDLCDYCSQVCGLCGGGGADKIPHPVYWPGEDVPITEFVHSECEDREAERAMLALSMAQRAEFLASIK